MQSISSLCLIAVAVGALVSCANDAVNRASTERLAELRDVGIDQKSLDRANAQLESTLGRKKAILAIGESYGGDATSNPAAVDLATVFKSSLAHSPQIGQAAQTINRASAQRMNAIFGYLPQVSYTFSRNRISQEVVETDNAVFALGTADYPVTNHALELRQPIFELSRLFGIRAKNTARTVAEARYIAAVQETAYDAFDAYVVAAQSKALMRELSRQASLLTLQASSEGALMEAGLAIESVLRTYRAERSSVASDEAIEAARYASALGDLSYLTGIAISDVQPLRVPTGIVGAERRITVAQAVSAAEQNNPALLATAISVVEKDLTRKQALAADFSPVVDAFARYEDEERAGSRFGGGSRTRETTVGVRLTIPIFNAQGRGYSALDTTVDVRDAALEYHATRRQLATDISSTMRRMSELSRATGEASRALRISRQNTQAERDRVDAGESIDIAVLSRSLSESKVRERLIYQEFEYLRAWGRLQYLTGAKLSSRQGF